MRLFLSNAVPGEDREAVTVRMQKVVSALKSSGHEPYCAMFDSHKDELVVAGDKTAIYEYAFSNVRSADAMVAIVASDKKSEGQLMEIGVLLDHKKPLYLFISESASASPTHLTDLATKTWIWHSETELINQLSEIS